MKLVGGNVVIGARPSGRFSFRTERCVIRGPARPHIRSM